MSAHRKQRDTAVLILRVWSADLPGGVCGRLLDAGDDPPVAWRTSSGSEAIIAAVGCWLAQFVEDLPSDLPADPTP